MLLDNKINIIIDTREQTPFSFPYWLCNTQRATLLTGDYSLEKDNQFCIERKSLNDFVSSVTRHWERFKQEIKRMEIVNFVSKVIIIEANFKDCCYYMEDNQLQLPEYDSNIITPQFLMKRIASLILGNVNIVFAGNNIFGSAICYSLLRNRYIQLLRGKNENTNKNQKSLI